MIYELVIEEGKEKPVIDLLRQLDFVSVTPLKRTKKAKALTASTEQKELSYFGTSPDWNMNVKEMRSKNSKKRIEGWL